MTDTLTDPTFSPRPARTRLQMSTEWREFDLAFITVLGEVDAANAEELLDYALAKALLCGRMQIDLTHVDFFGCEGYSTLKTLECRCIMADVELSVVAGPRVKRVLQVCESAARTAP